jgi:hypothetical protein
VPDVIVPTLFPVPDRVAFPDTLNVPVTVRVEPGDVDPMPTLPPSTIMP